MHAHEAEDIDRVAGAQLLRRNIEQFEAEGFRAMREAVLSLLPADSPIKARLQKIDQAIDAQRARLREL